MSVKEELMSFDEAIGLDEEFAHDSHQGDFARFASLAEATVEAGKGRMVLGGDQSGHVEGFADGGSAAPDFSLAAPLAAVAVEGGQSGQGSDLASVQLTQLGQVSHQLEGRNPSDSANLLEGPDGSAEWLGLSEEEADLLDQFVVQLLEGLEVGLDVFANEVRSGLVLATTLPMDLLQELISTLNQFDQLSVFWGERFLGSGMEGRSVGGEDLGIDPIGFGISALGTSEVADLTRIDAGERDLGLVEGKHQGQFIPSGGLKDDMGRAGEGTQPLEELFSPFAGVGELTRLGLRNSRHMHIQLLGSHIDSDIKDRLLHVPHLFLHWFNTCYSSAAEPKQRLTHAILRKGSFSRGRERERHLATYGRSFWTEARGGCDHVPARLGRGYPRPKPLPPPKEPSPSLTTLLS